MKTKDIKKAIKVQLEIINDSVIEIESAKEEIVQLTEKLHYKKKTFESSIAELHYPHKISVTEDLMPKPCD
jgi:hypothetical protein